MLDKLSPFDSKEEIEVGFIDMDDSESVDFVISCLLEDHCVDDGFPSFKGMSCANAEVDDSEDRLPDKDLFVSEGGLAWLFWFCVWKRFDEKRFIVSKVSSGWGCGGCFAPCLYFSFKFFFGDVGWKKLEFGGGLACVQESLALWNRIDGIKLKVTVQDVVACGCIGLPTDFVS